MEPVRVLVVDDHNLIRQGIVRLLETHSDFKVVGQASNTRDAVQLAKRLKPHVALMDLRLGTESGIEATRTLSVEAPDVRVLMLTVSEECQDMLSAIQAGAQGYILKGADSDDLFQAIRRVAQGDVSLSPSMTASAFRILKCGVLPSLPHPDLTPRQQDVLELLQRGASNRQISETLMISNNTVKTHVNYVLRKLGVHTRRQLVRYEGERSGRTDGRTREAITSSPRNSPEESLAGR